MKIGKNLKAKNGCTICGYYQAILSSRSANESDRRAYEKHKYAVHTSMGIVKPELERVKKCDDELHCPQCNARLRAYETAEHTEMLKCPNGHCNFSKAMVCTQDDVLSIFFDGQIPVALSNSAGDSFE